MSQDNVTEIKRKSKLKNGQNNSEKKSNSNPDDQPPKIKLHVREQYIIDALLMGTNIPSQVELPEIEKINLKYYKPDQRGAQKRYFLVNEEKGIVEDIDEEGIDSIICESLSPYSVANPWVNCFGLSGREMVSLRGRLLRNVKKQHCLPELPKPMGFKSTEGLFFERHNFDPIYNATREKMPIIFDFLDRTTNDKFLAVIIGSMLEGNPIRKVNPLFFGDSNAGKSTFIEIMLLLFGKKAWAEWRDKDKDMAAETCYEDTHIYLMNEAHSSWYHTEDWKRITGAERIFIRDLYKRAYPIQLKGVFFINQNMEHMYIEDDDSIKNRLLACKVTPPKKAFDQKITQKEIVERALPELPYFAGYCIQMYRAVKEGMLIIDKDDSPLNEVCENSTVDFDDIVDRYFEFYPNMNPHDSILQSKGFLAIWRKIAEFDQEFIRLHGGSAKAKKKLQLFMAKKAKRRDFFVKIAEHANGVKDKRWVPKYGPKMNKSYGI